MIEPNVPEVQWETMTQDELRDYAETAIGVSKTIVKWTLCNTLAKTMLWYSIVATSLILIGHGFGVAPIKFALVNVIGAALLALDFQLLTRRAAKQVQSAIQRHDDFVKQLAKKDDGEQT